MHVVMYRELHGMSLIEWQNINQQNKNNLHFLQIMIFACYLLSTIYKYIIK